MVVPRERLVEWLNSIEWLGTDRITREAEELIAVHLRTMRDLIKEVMAHKAVSPVEAHGFVQTAGHDSPEGESLIDELFARVVFRRAGVRECLIANIAACYCWDFDAELRHLSNPWLPLMELYGMGYTSSTDDDPDGNGMSLQIGYKDGFGSYRIV